MEPGRGTNPKFPHKSHRYSCQCATPGLCQEWGCAGHTQHCQSGGFPGHGVSVGHKMGHKGTAAGPGDPGAVLMSHSDLILHVSSQPFLAHRDGREAANKRGSQQSPVFTCPVQSMTPKAESTALAASAKTGPVTAAPQPSPSCSHALNVDAPSSPFRSLPAGKFLALYQYHRNANTAPSVHSIQEGGSVPRPYY